MPHYPFFTFDFEFRAPSRSEAFDRVTGLIRERGLLEIAAYALPNGSVRSGDCLKARQAFLELLEDGPVSMLLQDEQRSDGGSLLRPRTRPDVWESHWTLSPDPVDPEHDGARKLAGMAQFLVSLLRDGWLLSALVTRQKGGAECLPDAPLAKTVRHAMTVTMKEIEASYDRPQDFLSQGWSKQVEQGGLYLCTRALDAVAAADYLQEVQPMQWALARAAKPRLCRYYDVSFEEGEEEVFRSGPSRLELVGYMPATRVLEYSCVLGPGQHVQGWEIRELEAIVRAKKLPEGRPVETVRVVFVDRKAAESEKRPLLDVDVRVYFMDERSQDVEITE